LSDRQAGRGRPHPKGRNAVEDRAKAIDQSALSRIMSSKRARLRAGAAGLKGSAAHPANIGNGPNKAAAPWRRPQSGPAARKRQGLTPEGPRPSNSVKLFRHEMGSVHESPVREAEAPQVCSTTASLLRLARRSWRFATESHKPIRLRKLSIAQPFAQTIYRTLDFQLDAPEQRALAEQY
jgi:hypothetical protein